MHPSQFYLLLLTTGFILISCASTGMPERSNSLELVEVRQIWGKAPHNAFTDLIRYDGKFYCTFREGETHWSEGANGKIRVIVSENGESWKPTALLSMEGDLRDPKLSITPDNQLMLTCFRRFNPTRYPDEHEQTFAYFSRDGHNWSKPVEIGTEDRWLWRITWYDGKAYGISYGGAEGEPPFNSPRFARLLISDDGRAFESIARFDHAGESTIRFTQDGTAYCLFRSQQNRGLLGISSPDYQNWTWKDLQIQIGGPDMIQLDDGRFLAVVRLYEGEQRTSVCWLSPETGTLTEALELPSGGDTSYAGMVEHDGYLWVSYYSSHEEKTAIYLAKISLNPK